MRFFSLVLFAFSVEASLVRFLPRRRQAPFFPPSTNALVRGEFSVVANVRHHAESANLTRSTASRLGAKVTRSRPTLIVRARTNMARIYTPSIGPPTYLLPCLTLSLIIAGYREWTKPEMEVYLKESEERERRRMERGDESDNKEEGEEFQVVSEPIGTT